MTVSERIRHTRQSKRLSQVELADRSGINRKSLSRYELGGVPPADALKAIADALAVSTDYLLSGDEAPVKDRELLAKLQALEDVDPDTRAVVDNFLDLVIRDHRARKAYAA